MHARLLACSSLAMAAAAGAVAFGAGVAKLPLPTFGLAAVFGAVATAITAWRDREVSAVVLREVDPPLASFIPVGAAYRELTREPDPIEAPAGPLDAIAGAAPRAFGDWFCNDEFVRPAPPRVAHAFARGDRVEFTLSEFDLGEVTHRGTVTDLYRHERARVVCDQVTVNAPLAMLTYVGDA